MSHGVTDIVKVTVTASVTYSKTAHIYVEEGYTEVDLREAFEKQVGLPAGEDKSWICDEYEVLED